MSKPKITILYVDDEEINLLLFKMNFGNTYSIYTASNPFQGLNDLDVHQDEIIVVISDMKMPKMNGLEFIRKAREKYKHVVYFILSGYNYDEEIQSAVQNKEIQKFFSKPMVNEDIENAIEEAIEGMN